MIGALSKGLRLPLLRESGRLRQKRGETRNATHVRGVGLWCGLPATSGADVRALMPRTKESVHKAASAQPPDADEEEETTVRRRFIGQCKKGNCCLEDGHAGSCNDGNMSEEEYEVECITAEKATRGGKRKFLVKWKGWPSEDSTWETSAALAGAKEVRAPSSRVLNLACSALSLARSLARAVARY